MGIGSVSKAAAIGVGGSVGTLALAGTTSLETAVVSDDKVTGPVLAGGAVGAIGGGLTGAAVARTLGQNVLRGGATGVALGALGGAMALDVGVLVGLKALFD